MESRSDEAIFASYGMGLDKDDTEVITRAPRLSSTVTIPLESATSTSQALQSPSALGAGLLLVAKMVSALVDLGHSDTEVQKVVSLCAENIMTSHSTKVTDELTLLDGNSTEAEVASEKVHLMLQNMLDRNSPRGRTVRVNSNEPVLLVNCSSAMDDALVRHVVNESRRQLQTDWGVWPVRVWGGAFVTREKTREDGKWFEISVLNVVNTDIGGPSMVQLLEHGCSAKAWNRWSMKEAWNSRDFLSGDERNSEHFEAEQLAEANPADDAFAHPVNDARSKSSTVDSQDKEDGPSQHAPIPADASQDDAGFDDLQAPPVIVSSNPPSAHSVPGVEENGGEAVPTEESRKKVPSLTIQQLMFDRGHDGILSEGTGESEEAEVVLTSPSPSAGVGLAAQETLKTGDPRGVSDDDFELVEKII